MEATTALVVLGMCSAVAVLLWALNHLPEFNTDEAEHSARLQGETQ